MYKMTARKIKFFAIGMLLVGAFNSGNVFGMMEALQKTISAVGEGMVKVAEAQQKRVTKLKETRAAEEKERLLLENKQNREPDEEVRLTLLNGKKKTDEEAIAAMEVDIARAKGIAFNAAEKGIDAGIEGVTASINSNTDIKKAKAVAKEQALGQALSSMKNHEATLKWLKDPKNLLRVVGITVAGIATSYLLYQGIKISAHYVESHLDQPTLVRTSSQLSLKDKVKSLFKKEEIESRMSEIVIEPQIWEQLLDVAEETQKAKEFDDNLMNVMFYGPPGTGKTLFAKELALHTGLDFAMMSGADFSQFDEGKDIKELHKLFDWAEKSKKGLLIFVDEAEVFLADRGAASTDTRSKRLTDAFLSRVEKPTSKNLMFVFATNHPEVIDNAVLSRIGRQIKFDLPAIIERTKILNLYFKKLLQDAGVKVSNNVLDKMGTFADQMDGFSPRQIETTIELMIKKARYKTNSVLTPEVANKVIGLKVKELKDQLAIKAK
mgnify:CR=1 FL=1|jgi:ATPase family AAA domain-containing protein 3A/B